MKLLPFNLEAALRGEKVVNGEGTEITEIHLFETENTDHRICAIRKGYAFWVNREGMGINNISAETLYMAPKTKTHWVNIFRNMYGELVSGGVYSNKMNCINEGIDACNRRPNCFVKEISFEIEEE